ncbi:hypothetical protein ABZY36_16085 [Streptomyces sp. NPDC006627]|uniref:hypothetical protein n=1 Tax=Streptomyces sp. NPDC006627 TaxID=3154679 RepID=UPI0033BA47DE
MTLRMVLVVAVLCAGVVAVAPAVMSYAVQPAPRGPLTTVDETPRAGSRAGEGRARPGRADVPLPDPPPPSTPPPSVPSRRPEQAHMTQRDTVADAGQPAPANPALSGPRVLPLGAGLVLIGLGLGFLGLRLRRG